jgi:hypothetical protein
MKNTAYWLEFFGTYGWAILVVTILFGSLIYFGKLSPNNLLPISSKVDKACEEQCADEGLFYKGHYSTIEDGRYQCQCMQPFILNITINK